MTGAVGAVGTIGLLGASGEAIWLDVAAHKTLVRRVPSSLVVWSVVTPPSLTDALDPSPLSVVQRLFVVGRGPSLAPPLSAASCRS